MAKKTNSKIFAKNEVLGSNALNQKFEDVGSVGGVQPYDTNHSQDTTMSMPIGSKATPFGNLFCKGINLFTQAEILDLVSAGKLTATDRMLFIDPNTSGLYIFNGSQIQQVGGSNMDYLFGDGSDGNVTLIANANYDTPKNFTDFTLNSGVTLSVTNALTPLIIRCTGTCTINGTIDLSGKGYQIIDTSDGTAGVNRSYRGAGGGTGGGGTGGGYGSYNGGAGGSSTLYPAGTSAIQNVLFQSLLSMNLELSCGGSGGNGTKNGSSLTNFTIGAGGAGGGAILIIAKSITGTGNIFAKGSNGVSPSSGSNRSGGGGGGGGEIALITSSYTFSGSVATNGGNGGSGNGGGNSGNTGGNGTSAVLII